MDSRDALAYMLMAAGTLGASYLIGSELRRRTAIERRALRSAPPVSMIPAGAHPNVIVIAPSWGSITMEEAESFAQAIARATGPVDIVLHTIGGSVLAVDYIANTIRKSPHPATAHVPYFALSGGTMIALACDSIAMNRDAILGPVDPQVAGVAAVDLIDLVGRKPIEHIDDQWMLLAIQSQKVLEETRSTVEALVSSRAAVERLISGQTSHGRAITFDEARELGLPIKDGVPSALTAALDVQIACARARQHAFPTFHLASRSR